MNSKKIDFSNNFKLEYVFIYCGKIIVNNMLWFITYLQTFITCEQNFSNSVQFDFYFKFKYLKRLIFVLNLLLEIQLDLGCH